MHSLAQETSPAAVRTSARQKSLRSHPPIQTLTCASFVSLPQERIGARFSQGEAADGAAPAYRVILQLPQQHWRLSRSARRSRRVDRCGLPTRPRVEWPRLARSRLARRFGGRVFRRCCGPALGGRWRGRLASARGHWLAAARARAIAVGRLAACAWRAAGVGSGEPFALTGRFPGAFEWRPAGCKPRGWGFAVW